MSAPQIERRISASPVPLRSEGRAGAAADGRRLIGYAAVFNSLSENLGGGMREIIEPGAFTKALRTSDVRALLNHNPNYVLGRTKSGTLRLNEDATGLRAEIDVPKTATGDGVLESVRRGDISQMSFAFRVEPGIGDRFSTGKDGVTVRRIVEIQELIDVSPVAFAAYSETVVSVRALQLATETAKARPPRDLAAERRRNDAEIARCEEQERRARTRRILNEAIGRDVSRSWVARVCDHESGHAVMYWATGAGVDAVGLVVDEDRDRVRVSGSAHAKRQKDPYSDAQASLGGIACERLAGYDAPGPTEWPMNSDVNRARKSLAASGRSSGYDDIEHEIARVEGVLRQHWPAVVALSREIWSKTALTGEEAEAIIQKALFAKRVA